MKNHNRYLSYLLVSLQFVCIILIIITGRYYPLDMTASLLVIAAFYIGVWAILSMPVNQLTVMPDYKEGSILVVTGPYKYIRHPMYLAVLIFCLAMVINQFNIIRGVVFVILTVILLYKISYEEKQLTEGNPQYKTYMQRTKRLLPFIF